MERANIDVFISYHTESSKHIVEGIANRLEAAGFRCWYAMRDSRGAYATSIVQAIRQCRLFLLVLNRPASMAFYVRNEVCAFCDRLSNGEEGLHFVPFLVADKREDIDDEVKFRIDSFDWIDATDSPIFQHIDALPEYIRNLFGQDSITREKHTVYRLMDRMPQVRDVFLGRERLIEEIHQALSSGHRVVYLEGMGGIGKTELMKQYALRYQSHYDHIVFLTYRGSLRQTICDPSAILIEGLSFHQDEDKDTQFDRTMKALKQTTTTRTLFLLDNFDTEDDPDLPEFLSGNCKVLVSTRNRHPGAHTIQVGPIEDMEILLEIFQQNYGAPVDDRAELEAIIRLVDHHTYMVELIAKQMDASFLSAKEFRTMLEQRQQHFDETVVGRDGRDTAFGHICAIFDIQSLNDDERWILRCLSLMGIGGVKASWLRRWAGLKNFETVNQLIHRGWVRKESGQSLSLHPIVRDVVYARLTPTTRNMRSFIEAIGDDCYTAWYRPYTENLEIADCIQTMVEYFRADDADCYVAFEAIISYLWQVGRFDASIRLGHHLYDACATAFGMEDMRTGFAARALGGCYFNSGRREESVQWYLQGLVCMRASGAPESEDLAMSYEKAGRCHTWPCCRDFEKAARYMEEGLAIRLRLREKLERGEPVPGLLTGQELYDRELADERIGESYMELGRMYQAMGRYETALEYTEKYQQTQDRTAGRPSENACAYAAFDMAVSHYHLAMRLRRNADGAAAEDQLRQACRLAETALEIQLRLRGGLAEDTIDSQLLLADIYAEQGRRGEAANACMAALNMVEELFGTDSAQAKKIRAKTPAPEPEPESFEGRGRA